MSALAASDLDALRLAVAEEILSYAEEWLDEARGHTEEGEEEPVNDFAKVIRQEKQKLKN